MKKNHSILIIDDEEGIQSALKEILELEGYSLATASTGQEALEILGCKSDFSLILLDFRLPDMSGFEFVGKMESETSAKTPIILLSAATGLKQMMFPPGIIDAICKPFEIEELLLVIQQFFDGLGAPSMPNNHDAPKVS